MLMRPPETLDSSYAAIKAKMDADYNGNQSIWQIFWTEANINTRLEAGDSSLMGGVLGNFPNNNNRGQYNFNRTRPLCGMVSGRQRQNRKKVICVPAEYGDQHTADQQSKILLNLFKRQHIDDTISEAFHQGACISGMNLLHAYVDWDSDPINGDIKVDNLAYSSYMIDPYFRKPDLSDCNFVWRRSYIPHLQAATLLPDKYYDEVMALPGNPTGMGRDGRFNWQPEAFGQAQQNRVAYDEYYYRDFRTATFLVDKETGATREVDPAWIDINAALRDNPRLKKLESQVPTVRLCIRVQGKVFYDGPQPLGIDKLPFIPVIGFYNPMMPYMYSRIQSLCTSLRDPQVLLNRRIVLSADLLESQVNSGWIFKENSIIDVKHLFQTGQGRIIPLKQEAQMTDIQPIQPPQVPPSFFQMQETFSKELSLVTGINEELMGMASDAKAGITEMLRQGAGLVTLQPLFDRLDNSMVLLGELLLDIVKANYTPGKIQEMLEGEEPAPMFYNKAFGKYHCAVELGTNTDTQKQMQAAQLVQLSELGYKFSPKTMLNAFTIQGKDKIIQEMEQQDQQQSQMAQQRAQIEMQEINARINATNANAAANYGLGQERTSRVEENKALATERKAAAVKDDFQALLNYAKAIKELEGIDISQLQQIIEIKKALEESRNDTTTTNFPSSLNSVGISTQQNQFPS